MFDLKCEIVDVRKKRRHRNARRLPCAAKTSSNIINQTSHISHSSGVTLIELLIAIAIIAMISAMFLGASQSAMRAARVQRTRATILKLHTLIMEQWASYETRRVDINEPSNAPSLSLTQVAELRLTALRMTMQMEMPDRWSDITGTTVEDLPPHPSNTLPTVRAIPGFPGYSVNIPAVTRTYFRRYNNLNGTPAVVRQHQGAECLYQTIMLMTGDGEARTLFSDQDIGDTDGDGAPEFLDGWGQPIEWLRWPVGYVSSLQPLASNGLPDPINDHDPFDHAQVDPNAFRIVPLIYSPGPDGIFDITAATSAVMNGDPYAPAIAPNVYLGTQRDGDNDGEDNSIDNIHNHIIDGR